MDIETHNSASNLSTRSATNIQPQQSQSEVKKLQATYGMFLDRKTAMTALQALKRGGFDENDISILAPMKNGQRDFVYHQRTSIKEGAVIGSTAGFFILGFVGFLIGMSVSPETQANYYDINSTFPFWLLTALIGAVLGVVLGAACGALVGIGTPRPAAKRYGFYLKEGGIMLTVAITKESDRQRAALILEKSGAQDINILDESQTWSTVVPEKKKLAYT